MRERLAQLRNASSASPKVNSNELPCGKDGLTSMLNQLKLRRAKLAVEAEKLTTSHEIVVDKSAYFDAHSTLPLDKTEYMHTHEFEDVDDNARADCVHQMEAFLEASQLEQKIIRQVEYYFGDYNLPKDKFMLAQMDENDGWFDMDSMLTFKRLRSLTTDGKVVLEALQKSPHGLLQVENWGEGRGRIRRDPRKEMPEQSDARKIAIQERSVFVWGFDRETTTLDDLLDFFEGNFEGVGNVRQRTQPVTNEEGEETGRKFMGSVFVTFNSDEAARKFHEERDQLIFKSTRKLNVKWQKEFYDERTEFNDVFDQDNIAKTAFVFGFDKQDTTEDELGDFFRNYEGATDVRKRVFRLGSSDTQWRFTGGVFVTFDTVKNAMKFLTQPGDVAFNGDKLTIKTQERFYEERGKFRRELAQLRESRRSQSKDI